MTPFNLATKIQAWPLLGLLTAKGTLCLHYICWPSQSARAPLFPRPPRQRLDEGTVPEFSLAGVMAAWPGLTQPIGLAQGALALGCHLVASHDYCSHEILSPAEGGPLTWARPYQCFPSSSPAQLGCCRESLCLRRQGAVRPRGPWDEEAGAWRQGRLQRD